MFCIILLCYFSFHAVRYRYTPFRHPSQTHRRHGRSKRVRNTNPLVLAAGLNLSFSYGVECTDNKAILYSDKQTGHRTCCNCNKSAICYLLLSDGALAPKHQNKTKRQNNDKTRKDKTTTSLAHVGGQLLGVFLGGDVHDRAPVQVRQQREQRVLPALGGDWFDLRHTTKQHTHTAKKQEE